MKSPLTWACALVASAILAGCTAMPEVEPVEVRTEQKLLVGEPFVYQTTGEPLDAVTHDISILSVDDALRLALRHNPQIQSALARLRQAEADARQTRLLPNPVLGIAFRFPSGGGRSVIDADLSAELLSLITRPGRIAAIDHRLRKAAADALTTVLDVAIEVQRQYTQVQAFDARVEVAESRRQILQGLVDITNARLRAGEAARLDVLTAQSQLSSVDSELISLRSQRRLGRLTLARLIGQPSSPAEWSLSKWLEQTGASLPDQEWIKLALNNRPEIESIQWELAALGQEVRLARLSTLLDGSAGVSAERDDVWSVGPAVSLPIPIFDTGSVSKQRVESLVVEQRHDLVQASRVVIEEVRRSLETLSAAQAGLHRVQNETLPLQQQRLQQAQAAYKAGLTDVVALRLAEQDLQDVRGQVIDLQQQVSQASFERDRAVGGAGVYLRPPTTSTSPTTQLTERAR